MAAASAPPPLHEVSTAIAAQPFLRQAPLCLPIATPRADHPLRRHKPFACSRASSTRARKSVRRSHQRWCRDVESPSSCARRLIEARVTDETSRSESGDPVCRPIRLLLSSYPPSLRCRPQRAMLRVFSATRQPSYRADSVAAKLICSARYSKCFFAGVQCLALMTHFPPNFWQEAREASRLDRDGPAPAQAPPRQTVRRRPPPGRRRVRRQRRRRTQA
jgi:hypothetical protein